MILKIFRIYELLVLVSFILYLPRIFGFRYGFKASERRKATKNRRICVIVPARGESAIIGDLFVSLKAQKYERDNYEVFVIVKDSDDPTIELSEQAGYKPIVAPNQHCKGDALNAFFDSLERQTFDSFDAFVIVDADGYLSPDYLVELNNALEGEADIIVSRKLSKNSMHDESYRSVYANCASLTWPIIDELGNCYRMKKDIPLVLCGQGLCLKKHVVEEIGGWPYRTLTEDYELRLDSMLRGYRSAYCQYATIYTEEALGHKENYLRRARWVTGRCQCHRKYRKAIKKNIKDKKKINRGEFEYFFGLVPYMIFLVATILTSGVGLGITIFQIFTKSPMFLKTFLLLFVIPISFMYMLLFIFSVLAMESSKGGFDPLTKKERALMVIYNPIFLLEYIFVFVMGIIRLHDNNGVEWHQTERINKHKHEK